MSCGAHGSLCGTSGSNQGLVRHRSILSVGQTYIGADFIIVTPGGRNFSITDGHSSDGCDPR